MKPSEREDSLYSKGKTNLIGPQEKILFEYLESYVPTNGTVVDVGCGTGEISLAIMEKGFRVVGFDFSRVAISKAVEKGIDAKVIDFDELGIPLGNETAECIYAGDVIEHVFDPMMLFREFARVMKPDGVVLASLPHDANLSNLKNALFARSFQESLYKQLGACKHHSFISIDLLKIFSSQANLSIEAMTLTGHRNIFIRNREVERRYRNWQVPLWARYLTHKICIVFRKPTN